MSKRDIEQELEKILHLNGCEQRTAGYTDHMCKKDIDLEDMEQLEKLTLKEVMQAVTKHTERAVLEGRIKAFGYVQKAIANGETGSSLYEITGKEILTLKTQLEAEDE